MGSVSTRKAAALTGALRTQCGIAKLQVAALGARPTGLGALELSEVMTP